MVESPISFTRKLAQGDRGNKVYELSNHLGNVLATVSDKKLGQILGGSTVASYYEAQVQSAQDYYAFGWRIPSRTVTTGKKYMFGFNGQVEDEEWNGGQSVNFLFRVHDPRIGRFLSVDPLEPEYPWNTPYGFAENDVIRSRDLEGAESDPTTRRPSCGSGTTQSSGTSSTQRGGSNAPGNHRSDTRGRPGVTSSNNGSRTIKEKAAEQALKSAVGRSAGVAGYLFTLDGTGGVNSSHYPEKVGAKQDYLKKRLEGGYQIYVHGDDANDGIIGDTESQEKHDYITLYRGVNVEHGQYAESKRGLVRPNYVPSFRNLWGFIGKTPATAQEHNSKLGATRYSPYTSWTTDKDVAINFAVIPQESLRGPRGHNKRHGVVLTIVVARKDAYKTPVDKPVVTFHNKKHTTEQEYLLKGVRAAFRVENVNYYDY